jgi:hypothetical protein
MHLAAFGAMPHAIWNGVPIVLSQYTSDARRTQYIIKKILPFYSIISSLSLPLFISPVWGNASSAFLQKSFYRAVRDIMSGAPVFPGHMQSLHHPIIEIFRREKTLLVLYLSLTCIIDFFSLQRK